MLIKPTRAHLDVNLSPTHQLLKEYDFVCTIGYDDHSDTIYDYAFPVHQQHNAPGTFWVTTGRIEFQDRSFGLDRPSQWGEPCTWEQLREMHNSQVGTIRVENHTHSHPNMARLTESELWYEIKTSTEIFNKEGFNPKYLSYPYTSASVLARQFTSSFFEAARGGSGPGGGRSNAETNMFETEAMGIDTAPMSTIKQYIDAAKRDGEWIDLYMHAVTPTGLTDVGSPVRTDVELSEIIQYVKDNNGIILSFDDAVNMFMKNFYWTENNILQAEF